MKKKVLGWVLFTYAFGTIMLGASIGKNFFNDIQGWRLPWFWVSNTLCFIGWYFLAIRKRKKELSLNVKQ